MVLLAVSAFTLGTVLEPRALAWSPRAQSANLLTMLMGDSRRLFANHFFVQADVSFHSGYYPSIFDRPQGSKESIHIKEQGHEDHGDEDHEKEEAFLGPPRDWIEAFGRRFLVTEHTHLAGGNERETLPWLRLAADLDPQQVETYTTGAYMLRAHLHKPKEAEQFLREGLRANPDSYEILFDLGRLYETDYHDKERARNLWQLALAKWEQREKSKQEPDFHALEEIAVNLSRVEEAQGNLQGAAFLLRLAASQSPHQDELLRQAAELEQKLKPAAPKP